MNNIYYIENRGWQRLFHFVGFMIGGLHSINENTPRIKIYMPYLLENIHEKDWGIINSLSKELHNYSNHQTNYINNIINVKVCFDILDLIKDKYEVIYSLKDYNISDYNIIYNFGCPLDLEIKQGYMFLKQLFVKDNNKLIKGKYIYISRNRSDKVATENNRCFHKIINEDAMLNGLNIFNFETIYLEDLTFSEKLLFFQTAEIILACTGTALFAFTIFCNINSYIIEIIPEVRYQLDFTQNSTKFVGNQYIEFIDAKKVNEYDDMIVNTNKLMYIINNLIHHQLQNV